MKKGFTIIEILIAVAIITVLTVIAVASISSAKSKARDAERIFELKQLKGALENYFASCYTYPSASRLNDVLNDCDGNATLQSLPLDPTTGVAYRYGVITSPVVQFHICATLENNPPSGKAGTAKFNTNDPCDGTVVKIFDLVGGGN